MVRKAEERDLPDILIIYDRARAFMRASGNTGRFSELRVRYKQKSMQNEIKSYLELYCVIVVLLIVVRCVIM